MRLHITRAASVVAALAAGLSISMAAPKTTATRGPKQEAGKAERGEGRGKVKDEEKRVAMKDLPAAVQKTVREQSQGATIRGLAQETENGKMNYEVELKVNGHNKDVLIDPSGAVVEVEEQVALDSLPAAVKTTIEQNAGGGKVVEVESITEGNTLTGYEARVRKAGKSREIKVGPAGQLMSKGKG
jgi:uncharacterized membrane protein YkoI